MVGLWVSLINFECLNIYFFPVKLSCFIFPSESFQRASCRKRTILNWGKLLLCRWNWQGIWSLNVALSFLSLVLYISRITAKVGWKLVHFPTYLCIKNYMLFQHLYPATSKCFSWWQLWPNPVLELCFAAWCCSSQKGSSSSRQESAFWWPDRTLWQ